MENVNKIIESTIKNYLNEQDSVSETSNKPNPNDWVLYNVEKSGNPKILMITDRKKSAEYLKTKFIKDGINLNSKISTVGDFENGYGDITKFKLPKK